MHEKRLVTFRMAPKKSTKGKDAKSRSTLAEGWLPSKCTELHLQTLVSEGLQHARSVVQWRPALGHNRPYENTGEIVAFAPYFERSFGLPCSNFFCCLLYYYGIQLHHLLPNSILHISIFVHLCEAFLGIEPHFELFCHLFHFKPQPNSKERHVVGGAGIQLHQGME